MRRHIRFLIILAVIGSASTIHLAGTTSCNLAFACECGEPKSPEEAFEEVDAVFSGKVTAIREDRPEFEPEKIVSLAVDHVWKGVSNDTNPVIVRTSLDTAGCGFPFEENREYLVYAYDTEGQIPLEASLCTRTTPIENAQADLAFLDPGYVPVKSDGGNPTQNNGRLAIETEYFRYVPLVIVFGAAIAGVLAFLFRPQKRN